MDAYDPKLDYQVITGDCLQILPALAAGSVDAVITDPPYGIEHESAHGASWMNTQIANDSDTKHRDAVIGFADSRGLAWVAFGSWKRAAPATTRGCLVWDKGPAFGMGDLYFPWKPSFDLIYVGGPGWEGRRDEGVLRGHLCVSWESKGRTHPHEKPVSLMVELLKKLPNAMTVLDPFCGSGTTGVACRKLGRKFIGIEIDPGYAAIARRRIAEAGFPLFGT